MMFRLSATLPGLVLTAVGLLALTSILPAQAPKPPEAATTEAKSVTEIRSPQEQNAELFRAFQKELLTLAQKLERSDRPEDKARSKIIMAALELSRKQNVEAQFQKMIAGMRSGTGDLRALDALSGQDQQLMKTLNDILTLLLTDDENTRLKEEIKTLEEYLKEVRELKRKQEIVRAMTDTQRGDPKKIADNQKDLADQTNDLAKKMNGDKKDGGKAGEPGEKAVAKSEPKSEAKEGENAGLPKTDTEEAKSDSKEGGKEGKPNEGGDPKKGENANAEAKDGGKEGKPMESGSAKEAPKPGDMNQAGEPKEGEGKPSESKEPSEGKPSEGKPSEGKPSEGKPSEGKPMSGESKSKGDGKGESKPSEGKGGESKSKGESGSESPPMEGGSKGEGGQGESGESGKSGQPPQPQPKQTPGRKQLEEAYPQQKGAKEDLDKNKRDEAGKKEDKAIEKLAEAIRKLEERLKQLREEEMLKMLANLEARCGRMLQMQIEVYEATKAIDGAVQKNKGEKTTAEVQKAQQQAVKEGEIVTEATKALKMLESEGSAVAFAIILGEVREDMIAIQRRLDSAYVDKDTQSIEENVIALLKEMVDALKKKQEEMKAKQGEPPPPGGSPPPPGNKKLIDLIAELKLIKALQVQINSRTKNYGEKSKGEQAADPIVQAEIRQLTERQAKLQTMIDKIASGENQ